MSSKRFRVAFSFAGEKRDFVAKVAAILAERFGEEKVLYDKFHEAEFAVYDLGMRLPRLYGEQSDLIVPVLCPKYDQQRWTGWEWVQIYGLLTRFEGHRVMPCRFGHASADGLSPAAGFIELDDKTPQQAAKLILERLALNEGKPKNHYMKSDLTRSARFVASSESLSQLPIPHSENATNDPMLCETPGLAPPRVFLSYSWDSDEHKQRVLELAQHLRQDGVDAWMDRFVSFPEEGWLQWMRNEIKKADFVLVISTATYSERFEKSSPPGIGLGATWEGAIITQTLFDNSTRNAKFIPVVFKPADTIHIPECLRAFTRFCPITADAYDSLYRVLTNQPEVIAAPIGPRRPLESTIGVSK